MEALPRYYLPDEQLLGRQDWLGNGPGNHEGPQVIQVGMINSWSGTKILVKHL